MTTVTTKTTTTNVSIDDAKSIASLYRDAYGQGRGAPQQWLKPSQMRQAIACLEKLGETLAEACRLQGLPRLCETYTDQVFRPVLTSSGKIDVIFSGFSFEVCEEHTFDVNVYNQGSCVEFCVERAGRSHRRLVTVTKEYAQCFGFGVTKANEFQFAVEELDDEIGARIGGRWYPLHEIPRVGESLPPDRQWLDDLIEMAKVEGIDPSTSLANIT